MKTLKRDRKREIERIGFIICTPNAMTDSCDRSTGSLHISYPMRQVRTLRDGEGLSGHRFTAREALAGAAPPQPKNLKAELLPGGEVRLRWKASIPMIGSGTSYVIRRRLPGEGGFTVIGVAGKKVFVVKSIPGGTAQVQYTIEGQRSSLTGPMSEILTVNFGRLDTRAT